MSKKYKELPAFETNEFKVGDKVRIYRAINPKDSIVIDVQGDWVYLEDLLNRVYHFKQCRKLEEVKLREFRISLPNYTVWNRDRPMVGEYIQVREVLEDEDHD